MSKEHLLRSFMQDPGRIYRDPSQVERDRRFSTAQKLELLAAWRRIAEGKDTELVKQIVRAKTQIEDSAAPAIF